MRFCLRAFLVFLLCLAVLLPGAARTEASDVQSVKPTISIKVLRMEQRGRHTKVIIEVKNESQHFLSSLQFDVAAFDAEDKYMGRDRLAGMRKNVRPGDSYIGEILLMDVHAVSIYSWKISPEDLMVEYPDGRRFDGSKVFEIKYNPVAPAPDRPSDR